MERKKMLASNNIRPIKSIVIINMDIVRKFGIENMKKKNLANDVNQKEK